MFDTPEVLVSLLICICYVTVFFFVILGTPLFKSSHVVTFGNLDSLWKVLLIHFRVK